MRLLAPLSLLALVPASMLVAGLALARESLAFAGAAGAAVFGASGMLAAGAARITSPTEVLQHDARRRIHAHLARGVGASLTQLTDALGLTATNTIWHLRKLERAGLVRERRFHGVTLYYLTEGGAHSRDLTQRAAALGGDNAREMFQLVLQNPGVHQRELARMMGVNPGTVRWHARRLVDAGLLEERPQGSARVYHATASGVSAWDALRGAPALASG